jgi:hypothetical protein
MPEIEYALSIRQPWAALLLHGIKTIEVRSWPTARRGRILIHAARLIDPYPVIWKRLSPEVTATARLLGGVIGSCELLDCVAYRTRAAFAADRDRHLNDPSWFRPPALYGFRMANPIPLQFRPYPGWVRFFQVKAELPRRARKKGVPAKQPGLFGPEPGA